MPANPRMRLALLRIVVLAFVLAVFPVKGRAYEASFFETPVLVVSAHPAQVADVQPAYSRRVTLLGFEPVESQRLVATQQMDGERPFIRVFRRFVVECSWLC